MPKKGAQKDVSTENAIPNRDTADKVASAKKAVKKVETSAGVKKKDAPSNKSDAGSIASPAKDAGAALPPSSLKGEYLNISLLLLLYTLQGVPMGLFGAVNMEVKALFKDSFSEQGTFMLAAWPFSLKLFWAPLVDSWYSESFGRRKTWMIPAQFAIGLVLLYLAPRIDDLFAAKDINTLTAAFFALYFLCATQDIAVDGWALTMLRTENAGYASTCNSVGQTVGFTLGFMIPMAKVVPLPSFLFFWGTVFVATTAAVWALKSEAATPADEEVEGCVEAYTTMARIACRPAVRGLVVLLFTRALAFIPMDVMASGRLQDRGFPKESLATMKLVVTPLEIVLPWVLSSYTAGPRPLSLILLAYVPRAFLTLVAGVVAFMVGDIATPAPWSVYAAVFALTIIQGVISNAMFVAHMAFFAKVSDPAIGGTYMTFLNTVHNLGNMWASTFCLKLSDHIQAASGFDGFYALCGGCAAFGVLWYLLLGRRMLLWLQELPMTEWRVTTA